MDRILALLQNADPADPVPDSAELLQLEGTNLNAAASPLSVGDAGFFFICFFNLFHEQEPVNR